MYAHNNYYAYLLVCLFTSTYVQTYIQIVNDLKETVDVHFRETDTVPLPSAPVSPSILSGEGVYLPLALMGKPHAAVFVKPVKDG